MGMSAEGVFLLFLKCDALFNNHIYIASVYHRYAQSVAQESTMGIRGARQEQRARLTIFQRGMHIEGLNLRPGPGGFS